MTGEYIEKIVKFGGRGAIAHGYGIEVSFIK
jgi:hypothetical protein